MTGPDTPKGQRRPYIAYWRYTTRLHNDPRVAELSPKHFWCFLSARCWITEQQSDGVIPRQMLRRIDAGFTPKVAERLVEVGLWECTSDGWRDADYLEDNPSREQEERLRQAQRERQQRYRNKQRSNASRYASRNASVDPTKTRQEENPPTSDSPPAEPLPSPGASAQPDDEGHHQLNAALYPDQDWVLTGQQARAVLDNVGDGADE